MPVVAPQQQDPTAAPAATKNYSRRKPINHVVRVSFGFREAVNEAACSLGVSAASIYRAAVVEFLEKQSNLDPQIAARAREAHEQQPALVRPSAFSRGEG